MKKFIILLVISIILSIPVFSQDSTKVDPNLKYVVEKMEKGISVLVEKLKTPAEHVYNVLIKQQKVVAYTEIGFSAVFLLITLSFLLLALADVANSETTWVGFMIVCGILFIIGLLFAVFDAIPRLINPEYYALDKILQILK